MNLKRKTVLSGLDSSGSVHGPVAGPYEHGNELPVSWQDTTPQCSWQHAAAIVTTSGSWPLGAVLSAVVVLPVHLVVAGTTQYPPPSAIVKKKSCHISLNGHTITEAHLPPRYWLHIKSPLSKRVILLMLSYNTKVSRVGNCDQQTLWLL
jgi:hypothetical protein